MLNILIIFTSYFDKYSTVNPAYNEHYQTEYVKRKKKLTHEQMFVITENYFIAEFVINRVYCNIYSNGGPLHVFSVNYINISMNYKFTEWKYNKKL